MDRGGNGYGASSSEVKIRAAEFPAVVALAVRQPRAKRSAAMKRRWNYGPPVSQPFGILSDHRIIERPPAQRCIGMTNWLPLLSIARAKTTFACSGRDSNSG